MDQNKYILALDVGGRRIGVALASGIARLPAPLMFIDREKVTNVIDAITELVHTHDVGCVVVGLPRGMEGQETAQTAVSRAFARKLSEGIQVPVIMQDEAGTSLAAEERLKQRGKAYQKGDIDAEAAAIILQDYLAQEQTA